MLVINFTRFCETMRDNLLLTARIMGLGWYVAISILLGAFAGMWLDQKFHTGPFLMVFGTFFWFRNCFIRYLQNVKVDLFRLIDFNGPDLKGINAIELE